MCQASPARAQAPEEPYRLRFTETSVTEGGHVTGFGSKLHTRGYGLTFIFPAGLGLSYTFLNTYGDGPSDLGQTAAHLRHDYADLSYTIGQRWLLTGGAGAVLHGDARLSGAATTASAPSARGETVFLGPGVALGWLELYWIYRRSWVGYAFPGAERTLVSQLYHLGVGAHWSL